MASVSFHEHREVASASTKVIHGIGFDIQDGEFMVLVGPSGCGKSTLLRMLAGPRGDHRRRRSRSTARSVNDVESKDRDIAMVFQSYALYPHMTVRDNMGFSLRLRKADAKRDRRARRQRGADPEPRPVPRPLSARALRRPAPARRDGPRDRARSRRCSCSTSRCRTSTPSCASRCAPRSRRCTSG